MVAAKNYPAAEDYYAKALNLNPQSELVLLDMAMLREIEGKPKKRSRNITTRSSRLIRTISRR